MNSSITYEQGRIVNFVLGEFHLTLFEGKTNCNCFSSVDSFNIQPAGPPDWERLRSGQQH